MFKTTDIGWTTIIDTNNKLVIHVAINITKAEVDQKITDPDGIPLVWVEGKHVIRVRRMTDEEFIEYAKQYGVHTHVDIDMRVWHNTEKDVPKKE
jgi:hypothetical protein